jgi:hypothetical protein
VIGVYGLGWPAGTIVFQLWFDGATALGAMLAFHIRAFGRSGGRRLDPPR